MQWLVCWGTFCHGAAVWTSWKSLNVSVILTVTSTEASERTHCCLGMKLVGMGVMFWSGRVFIPPET